MFGVFGPLFILPKGKQHGSFSISLFTQLYGLNFQNAFTGMEPASHLTEHITGERSNLAIPCISGLPRTC
ncbi:hypothetical protein, partial [Geobacillus sp. 47C-IIb]|uniref:hypothetical protein n=1 Tax=Geobacillus sp. 47C-IIb TaxID=1963026 RepID=UPI001E55E6CA